MANRFFDTHTHMDSEMFDGDRDEALKRAAENGIEKIVNIGCDLNSSESSVKLAEKYDFVYAAVGIHPHSASEYNEQCEKRLKELLQNEKVLAIGEIGLDYYYDFSPRETQKKVFEKQMELAEKLSKKVIIHCRDATEDALEIIKKFPGVKGVFHCFSGSLETAKILVKTGYMVSFTGVLTYKNAVKPVQCVKELPIECIMAETDAPYLTPVPFRGKRNETGNVRLVVEKMAEIRGMDLEEISEIIYKNSERFYFS